MECLLQQTGGDLLPPLHEGKEAEGEDDVSEGEDESGGEMFFVPSEDLATFAGEENLHEQEVCNHCPCTLLQLSWQPHLDVDNPLNLRIHQGKGRGGISDIRANSLF